MDFRIKSNIRLINYTKIDYYNLNCKLCGLEIIGKSLQHYYLMEQQRFSQSFSHALFALARCWSGGGRARCTRACGPWSSPSERRQTATRCTRPAGKDSRRSTSSSRRTRGIYRLHLNKNMAVQELRSTWKLFGLVKYDLLWFTYVSFVKSSGGEGWLRSLFNAGVYDLRLVVWGAGCNQIYMAYSGRGLSPKGVYYLP